MTPIPGETDQIERVSIEDIRINMHVQTTIYHKRLREEYPVTIRVTDNVSGLTVDRVHTFIVNP